MLAAPAFAVTDFDVTGAAAAEDTATLAEEELVSANLSADGNFAVITQESTANIAYINQSGAQNFAAIAQSGNDGSIAVIYQTGDTNRSAIVQR